MCATPHLPCELTLIDADDIAETVTLAARSASRPGRMNRVTLATVTGLATCDCLAGERGVLCWHVRLAAAAWAEHHQRAWIAGLSDADLRARERQVSHLLIIYRRRRYRLPLADRVAAVGCREEYRRRAAALAAPAPTDDGGAGAVAA